MPNVFKQTTSKVPDFKSRNRARTDSALHEAIFKIKAANGILSIAAVAAEVGVHPSLIHHSYPEVAESIRSAVLQHSEKSQDSQKNELRKYKKIVAELKAEIGGLRKELAIIASINLSLHDQVDELKAELQGKLIRISMLKKLG